MVLHPARINAVCHALIMAIPFARLSKYVAWLHVHCCPFSDLFVLWIPYSSTHSCDGTWFFVPCSIGQLSLFPVGIPFLVSCSVGWSSLFPVDVLMSLSRHL